MPELKFSCPPDEAVGFYLTEMDEVLARTGKKEFDLIIDLGSHIGTLPVLAVWQYHAKKVIAVEADPENYIRLTNNIIVNGCSGKVIPIWAAIAPRSFEVVKLYRTGTSGQRSVKFDPEKFPYVEVPTYGLKDIIQWVEQYYNKIDLLKMDIEGAEWDFINQDYKDCFKSVDFVDISIHPLNDPKYHVESDELYDVKKVKTFFKKLGYSSMKIKGDWNFAGQRVIQGAL